MAKEPKEQKSNSKAIKVEVINTSKNPLPHYATERSAGVDLYANLSDLQLCLDNKYKIEGHWEDGKLTEFKGIYVPAKSRVLIPTGLKIAIPEGYEIQIRPRSGLALKNGITCLNTPGTIDSDYRGDVGVILINTSNDDFLVKDGDRIAQAVLNKVEQIEWCTVEELSATVRGKGGFGHTGK